MKNKIIIMLTIIVGVFSFTSCLNDTADNWGPEVAGKQYATFLSPGFHAKGIQPVADVVEMECDINIATDALPKSDITLNLSFDNAAISAYDSTLYHKAMDAKDTLADGSLKWKNYKPFPSAVLLTPTITIPAGSRTGKVKFSISRADTLKLTGNYMLAISITSVSPSSVMLSGNMNTYLLGLPINNEWAGDYDVVGYRIRPGNPTELISPNTTETLSTEDATTVTKVGFGNYMSYNVRIKVTTDVIVVGGVNCFKVIAAPYNPTTGATVGGMWPTWTGDDTLKPDDLTINYYNPATKTFVLNCYYNSSAGNRIMYEVLTRK